MATDSQKPNDTNPSVENPKKASDHLAPPSAKPDEHPKTDASSAVQPSSSDSASGKDADDPSKPAEVSAVAYAAAMTAPVSDIEKKMRRAERFGISVQLTEEEKRNSRAERCSRYYFVFFFFVNYFGDLLVLGFFFLGFLMFFLPFICVC